MTPPHPDARPALATAVLCYTLWGFFPLLFQALGRLEVGAWEMIAHRALWSAPFALVLVLLARQWTQVRAALATPRVMGWLALTSALVGVNWAMFVYATTSGHTLEAALGYYLNPLMNMAAGALLFRERIDRLGQLAIAFAAVGVAVQTAALGAPPWLSMGMAVSFCAYGVIRKRIPVAAQSGLLIECLALTLPGLVYVLWLETQGNGHFLQGFLPGPLLVLSGLVTVVALASFAWAARRLPLSTMGFLQFIGPTLNFAIGLSNGEPFTPLRALSFVFIWAGVAVFALSAVRRRRAPALSPHLSTVEP